MLSDEERKAIDNVKSLLLYSKEHEYFSPFQEQEIDDMNIVLNIVEKQFKEIEELKAYKDRVNELKQELEKEKEKNKDLKEGYKIQEHNYQVAMEEIEQRWVDKIKAKVIEIKDKPVEDEFITATQGKLNTIIDIENLLDEEE